MSEKFPTRESRTRTIHNFFIQIYKLSISIHTFAWRVIVPSFNILQRIFLLSVLRAPVERQHAKETS